MRFLVFYDLILISLLAKRQLEFLLAGGVQENGQMES